MSPGHAAAMVETVAWLAARATLVAGRRSHTASVVSVMTRKRGGGAQMTQPAYERGARRMAGGPGDEPTGWLGWVYFAGVVMVLLGIFELIAGLVALFRSDWLLVTSNNLVVNFNYGAWGWLHFAIGVLLILAGLAVFAGQMWGRVVGIVLAVISAIVNLVYIGAYPLWSLVIIAIDIVVIYALAVHGRETEIRPRA
jgi:hypothetical protein